jgi:hypothetical protein
VCISCHRLEWEQKAYDITSLEGNKEENVKEKKVPIKERCSEV